MLPESSLTWRQRREQLRAGLCTAPLPNIPPEEVEAHCDAMPSYYWESISQDDLAWGIQSVHAFFETISRPEALATTPFLDWRVAPACGVTRVMLCTWDRHGLLAKAAAAFSALNINIVQADVFTRADNVVLDVFHVSAADGRAPITAQAREEVGFLIAGALSEPPRFASVWAYSRHKYLIRAADAPPRLCFDNDSDRDNTVLRIEAPDRLGFLYDVLQTLADLGLDIKQARIHTENGLASDQFCFTDCAGQKVIDPVRLREIQQRIEASLV